MPAIPAIALGASVLAAGVATYSAVEQGKAQERLGEYNAKVAEQEAQDTSRKAVLEAKLQREEAIREKAKARAIYAKAGIVDTTGSPLLLQVEQAGELEKRAISTEVEGENRAMSLRAQGSAYRAQGASAKRAGYTSAAGSILSGVATTGSMYNQFYGKKSS